MKTRVAAWALTAVLTLTPLACVHKQSLGPWEGIGPWEGRTISTLDILFMGERDRSVGKEQIKALLESKPGTPLTAEKIDQDEQSLYESGLVDDCNFLVEQVGEMARLVVEVRLSGD